MERRLNNLNNFKGGRQVSIEDVTERAIERNGLRLGPEVYSEERGHMGLIEHNIRDKDWLAHSIIPSLMESVVWPKKKQVSKPRGTVQAQMKRLTYPRYGLFSVIDIRNNLF
jgi:hypothetical protein